MESILCVDIPVQMISCTDTTGKITPLRFRFRDRDGALITVSVDQALSEDQDKNTIGASYTCLATLFGIQRKLHLRYNYFAHEWRLARLHA